MAPTLLNIYVICAFRITVMMTNGHHWTLSAAAATGARDVMTGPFFFFFTYVNFIILMTI